MSILFIDTDCDLPFDKAQKAGIEHIINMPYTICGEEHFYDLGPDYNAKDFFGLIRKGNMPITSGLNVETYREYFEPFFAKNEDILYVSFSSELSSTFNYLDTAVKELSEKYPKAKFARFDTRAISMGSGLPSYYAGLMHKEGKTNQEIIDFLTTFTKKIKTIIAPDDLNHLKRGGRLTGVAAAFGTLLQIKPIIKIINGKLVSTGKVNGRTKSIAVIADEVNNNVRETDKYPIIIFDADAKEDVAKLQKKVADAHPEAEIWSLDVGPVVGTHCGPGTIAAVYIGDIEE
jgi:DegV family protein with EDD domain